MDLLGALGVLVRVVETGSFSAAARERELSQAAVARQIAQLEDHFGVRLFHRTTRKLSLTDDGQMLLGLARPVLDGVEGMEAALGQQSASPAGLVRVGVTVTASRFLSLRLPSLLIDHPRLKVELVVGDRLGDMIEDRLDLAMRIGEITDASLVVRRSGTAVRVAVAAPSYIERHGEPSSPAELANHTCIVHDVGPGSDVWTFVMPEGAKGFQVSGGFLANDVRAVHLAARTGYGIAYLALVEVFDDLRSGTLVRVLSDFPAAGVSFSLVYPSRRHLAPRTRLVMDFIWEQVRQVQAELARASDEGELRKRRVDARSLTQSH
ncbi:LysR family transcriptional regulator [Bradyrhizobium sp.]|jgi:DNA-binding transcriptional LysR family regulator|uniref:LysR family transcriptional regulator n=1 Tax=Bradyrhizobium sp. TaxID=376 RepID=UPI002CB579E2|nr:LysR family transcriptional regulator [Bradyrhizobium sp.]HWX59625.1 LysR family transcriptional regulator [Bradyrhizobium sp.]